ncbi:MAG: hypothetical protein KGH88_08635 [Thaumarchaeota archaeon]|nr:hypothetical protein [Nitrososphaerota archaeon]
MIKTKTIVQVSTLSLIVIGAVFAFLLIYARPTSQGPIPELVDKDTLVMMMEKFNPDLSRYDLNNMELLHIHKTGQVYMVDQKTLRDTDLYQKNLPNYPHDQYVWKVPLTEETRAGGQVSSTIYDASSGTRLGDVFPSADCPLGDLEQSNNGHEIVYLVYYAVLTNGKVSYVDPTLKGTFLGNEAEFELINKTQDFPEVSMMMHMFSHVCVDSFPTDLYLKEDPNFPGSKNDVEYLAMGRGTNNQIIIVDKFDSENRNIGRILYCGTGASPVYHASMREVFSCFNSTSSIAS